MAGYNNTITDINSKVGIGTGQTEPGAKLEVSQTTTGIGAIIGNTTHNSQLQIYTAAASKNSEIWFGDAADSDIGKIDYDHLNNSMAFTTNASEAIRIASSGNVGIGTTSPANKLTINNTLTNGLTYPVQVANITGGDGAGTSAGILFNVGYGGTLRGKGALVYNSNGAGYNKGDFMFLQNSVADTSQPVLTDAVVTIKNSGYVGIGTTAPAYKLDVDGSTRLGDGGDGSTPPQKTIIAGQSLEDPTGPFYGSYGFLELNATTNYTGSARRYAITNALDANKFAIIRSDSNMATMQMGVSGAVPAGAVADFVIDNTGKVGIGTTSPSAKLEVLGQDIEFYSGTGSQSLQLGRNANERLEMYVNDNMGKITAIQDADGDGPHNFILNRIFGGTGSNDFQIQKDGSTQLLINSTGNVGIGTTAPGAKLEIHKNEAYGQYGPVPSQLNLVNTNTEGTSGFLTLSAYYNNTNNTYYQVGGVGGGKETTVGDGGWGGYLSFYTTSDGTAGAASGMFEHMRITADGNVGIGTTAPSSLLSLGNAVAAQKLLLYDSNNNFKYGFGIQSNELRQFFPNSATSRMVFGTISDSDGSTFSEKMRIASDGNVGIGTTALNVSGYGQLYKVLTIEGSTAGVLELGSASQATSGGRIGEIRFYNKESTSPFGFASIRALRSGAAGSSELAFWTSTNNTTSAEKMRIDSAGAVKFNAYGAGTLVTDASGNITASSGGGEGGPYLPLTGGTLTGDLIIESALLSNQENTDVDTGAETVASVLKASYTAAFFDFVIKNGTNLRAGTVFACHDGTNVVYTETSTNDLGDTSDVALSVDISGNDMRLRATVTSDNWIIKSLIRAI